MDSRPRVKRQGAQFAKGTRMSGCRSARDRPTSDFRRVRRRRAAIPAFGEDALDAFLAHRTSPVRAGRRIRGSFAELADHFLRPGFIRIVEHPELRIDLGNRQLPGRAGSPFVPDLRADSFGFQHGLHVADDGEVDVIEDALHGLRVMRSSPCPTRRSRAAACRRGRRSARTSRTDHRAGREYCCRGNPR